MLVQSVDLNEALQKYFGFDAFKDTQEKIIQSVLDQEDTFVIMPTGGGKSLCYQLPALMMEGTALIISPLIALMKNQVDSIRGYSKEDNIAHFLNSSLNKTQIKEVKEDIVAGNTKMLFIAPETLTKDENIEFFKNVNISFVAVDEAHCISEWGHDFRPEYRRIKVMIDSIGSNIPIIALTATATPKVQTDIVKILGMENPHTYVSSFNRDNLFYEIRPKSTKEKTIKSIVQTVKSMAGKSGIIYVQSRKSTEEIAQVLRINGVKASPYHAGLDAKTRSQVQDNFLMEEIDVICATIAFGMGIDKPDVRFVIHYDIAKSIENYYQETGRAGRDGLPSHCIAYYSYKDISKLEKFLRDKPVAEREMGAQLLEEIIAFCETGACRRTFLLHYFGEEFEADQCDDLCDNCKNPKPKIMVKDEMQIALQIIDELNEKHTLKLLVEFALGRATKELKDFRYDGRKFFGALKDKEEIFIYSLFRQALLNDLAFKEVEEYGVLKISEKGRKFIASPTDIKIPINHDYEELQDETVVNTSGGGALDDELLKMLKELRLREAKKQSVKPWVIFFDPSLIEMATHYPISMDDMINISGVSLGKAKRYGKPFIELIKDYVEENNIERPQDFVVKQVANKSRDKVSIIQGIDKKFHLEEIADSVKLSLDDLLQEMYIIVSSGTKLNLDYYIDDNIDEEIVEEIEDYFGEAESDDVEAAIKEIDDEDITREEIEIVRLKFISENAI
ncbi:RecQ family ATP-dependent DNA helicase [Portibacter lacus]|uniref:ATP-dependent DNA helicase RecQ n=1 Tax=Portibacter lacus TaxID=1099794 RepID=A0AA37SNN5_9BACT|nr:ATP-dependent DNA helicase RecQ [Portibacter lacus]GLR17956.1 ATP-dependent DNA helicase RecQ [Portibacter lacus]